MRAERKENEACDGINADMMKLPGRHSLYVDLLTWALLTEHK